VSAQFLDGAIDPTHRYYNYAGKKQVGSIYGQEYYRFSDRLSTQATAQLRYIRYDFDQVKMGAFKGYDYIVDWLFFSPRIGLNYKVNDQTNLFANFAVASRTPTDEAIYEADDPWLMPSLEIESFNLSSSGDTLYQFGDPTAKSERLYDFEVGGQYRTDEYAFGVNFFWMDFHDEILPYGGVNESGVPITVNADRSLHTGIELTGSVKPLERVSLCGNFAYNYNRVKEFVTDVDGFQIDFKDKKVVGFPDYLGSIMVDYSHSAFRMTGRVRFVGRQYMELYNIDSLSIDPYAVLSASASYTIRDAFNMGDLTLSARVDNLFDKKYESAGYGGNFAYMDGANLIVGGWAEYFAAAERSFYAQLKLELF
jgi:iron complex outermembrane receptor protein